MSMPHFVDMRKEMDKEASEAVFGKTHKDEGLSPQDKKILEGGYIERKEHMKCLHDLDLLSSAILAIVYSGTASLLPGSQDAINQSTLACATDMDGRLIIATNNVSWQPKKALPVMTNLTWIATSTIRRWNVEKTPG